MSVGIGKKSNEYAAQIYDVDAPKTVFMAIAYRRATAEKRLTYKGLIQ
jgi:hypothetical protein